MTAIVLHVELQIKPEMRDDYIARALQHRANVLANKPACQRFDVSVEDDNPNTVRLYEVYDDEAAVEHHMQTDYMAAYREDTGPMTESRKITRAKMAG